MTDENKDAPYIDDLGQVCLPHSCDEWRIGGKKDVQKMIAQLQALLSDFRLVPWSSRRFVILPGDSDG